MKKTFLGMFELLVGTNLFFGLSLLIAEATHGLNDQDAGMLLVLIVHYMNLPAVSMVKSFDTSPAMYIIVLTGLFQWSLISLALSSLYHVLSPKGSPTPAGQNTH